MHKKHPVRFLSRVVVSLLATAALSANAMEHKITQPLVLSGGESPATLTPYQLSHTLKSDYPKENQRAENYTLYDVDYDELKRQISIYKTIYVYGQLLHGALVIKVKPKFVD